MNRWRKIIDVRISSIVFICLASVSCASVVDLTSTLTPTQLNAARDDYNWKRVTVRGWMRSEFENYALWQSKKANENGTFFKDCVSLLIPESMDTRKYNRRYVEIEGVFINRLPRNVVHLGGCNVTTLQLIENVRPSLIREQQ